MEAALEQDRGGRAERGAEALRGLVAQAHLRGGISKILLVCKTLQRFGGLVLGCIATKVCKQVCILQYLSSSTSFAHSFAPDLQDEN